MDLLFRCVVFVHLCEAAVNLTSFREVELWKFGVSGSFDRGLRRLHGEFRVEKIGTY